MSRARLVARGLALLAGAAAVVAVADATLVEPHRVTTTSVALSSARLGRALRGERIAHLSDLHFKGIGLRERRLLRALRGLKPALVLMTGDYADTPEGIEALREVFSQVRPSLGVHAVPGNNDYFRGRQEEIFASLREAGVNLLVNDVAVVEAPGGPLAIAGVDDPFFGRDDLPAVLDRIPPGLPAILLAHSPSILMERSEAILFNAGDAGGPWGKGAYWTDGSHFREPVPPILFTGDRPRRVRLQVREDGVALGALRLVPAAGEGPSAGVPRGLQGSGRRPPPEGPGVIEIDLCSADLARGGNRWRLVRGEGGSCLLEYGEDRGRLESHALPEPPEMAEIPFEAPGGTPYRVWARIHSPTSSGLSDSLYIQFRDSVDASSEPRFRIGSRIPGAGGPPLDLILAGHTHGGQVRIPWIGPVARALIPGDYVSGGYDAAGSQVHVSRGIGTSILPVRFACTPEVIVFHGETGASDS